MRINSNPDLILNGGYKYQHELIDPTLNDFFEFYIDGKPLLQHLLGSKKWIGYLEDYNGLLGTRRKLFDELLVKSLLKQKISISTIKSHYHQYNEKITDQDAESLIYELGLKKPLLYGCKICADYDCGGICIEVKKKSKYYLWFSYDQKSKNMITNCLSLKNLNMKKYLLTI